MKDSFDLFDIDDRKEAAEILKGLAVPVHAEPAMDMAIDLLEYEPKQNDLVNRQAVIDTIETDCSWDMFNEWGSRTPIGESIIEAIKRVPSVEPERKLGKWIWEDGNIPYCSICKKYSDDADMQDIHGEVKFCSHCGAKMKDTDVEI